MIRLYLPDIKKKEGEAVKYSFTVPLALEYVEQSSGEGNDFSLTITARSSGNKILVEGELAGLQGQECSRCLQPFQQKFKTDFSDVFMLLTSLGEPGEPKLLSETAANDLTVTGDYLYLDEYIRQQFILAQEFNPLCKPDCKGLCSVCGAELNINSCSCQHEEQVDHRMLKLKEINPSS